MQKYNKFLVALGSALAVAGSGLADGVLTGNEITAIAVAVVGAVLVWVVPNQAPKE